MTEKIEPSTGDAEALRLADALENLEATGWGGDCFALTPYSEKQAEQAAAALRRLAARVQELEAWQRDALRFNEELLDRQSELSTENAALRAASAGEVVVTRNPQGQIVAVTRQDKKGRILKVIAESAASAPAVPPGWKLVPVEPDGKMWSAGRSEFIRQAQRWEDAKTADQASVWCDVAGSEIYRAMLNAAPTPPKEPT